MTTAETCLLGDFTEPGLASDSFNWTVFLEDVVSRKVTMLGLAS
jgi:hypothetical protein